MGLGESVVYRLAAHQPDLFPYPGFWVKMARCSMFDLAIYDQFQRKGYQRRVQMRGMWAQHLVIAKQEPQRICDVRLLHRQSADGLINAVRGRYRGSRNWKTLGEVVCSWIDESRSELLWHQNLSLILKVRSLLGISTTLSIATQPVLGGIDGLVDLSLDYGAREYLSGDGGRAYMGDDPETKFQSNGVTLLWMNYQSPTSDSILTPIFDEEDIVSWFRDQVTRR